MTEPLPTLAAAFAETAEIALDDLRGYSRVPLYCHPRQAAMRAMRDAGHSYAAIGRYLGGRDPKTIKLGIAAHNRRTAG